MQNENYDINDIINRIISLAGLASSEDELFVSLSSESISVGRFTLTPFDLKLSLDTIDEVLFNLINMGAIPYDHAESTVYFESPAALLASVGRK